jgi:beta-lactam-binding protein with PASTA domain
VPKVIGEGADSAKAALQHAGLHASGIPVARLAGRSYIVTAESPKAGTWVKKGSTVKLTVTVKKG